MISKCDVCGKRRLWFCFLRWYDFWGLVQYTLCKNGYCATVLYMLEEKGIARETIGK